jgi:glutaredoxin
MTEPRSAILYRMVTDTHTCPFGLKSLDLLRRKGFAVDDRLLTTRPAIDAFKAEQGVKTTPQTFINGVRIGGYDDLSRHFGKTVRDPKAKTYAPVIALFGMAAAMALAASWAVSGTLFTMLSLAWFGGIAMCLLALQKLRDVETFSNAFLGYDLLAQRFVPYAYVYPFAEGAAGILMIAGALPWLSAPLALIIGGIGAVSVVKAVYIEGREIKCACVGGDSNVPLGFVSLAENLMMVAMGAWMGAHAIGL